MEKGLWPERQMVAVFMETASTWFSVERQVIEIETVIEEKTFPNGFKVQVVPDQEPSNPREFDNLGTMLCYHSRYKLGDEKTDSMAKLTSEDSVFERLNSLEGPFIYLPLYLMDHSGISMRTSDFGDYWDSGRVGLIYVSLAKLKEEGLTQDEGRKCLQSEVETYDNYLRGDCYGYVVYNEDNEPVESCWGFLGDATYAMAEGSSVAESLQGWKEGYEESVTMLSSRLYTAIPQGQEGCGDCGQITCEGGPDCARS